MLCPSVCDAAPSHRCCFGVSEQHLSMQAPRVQTVIERCSSEADVHLSAQGLRVQHSVMECCCLGVLTKIVLSIQSLMLQPAVVECAASLCEQPASVQSPASLFLYSGTLRADT